MANRWQRVPIDGGDLDVWGPIEEAINLLGLGTITAYLYNDAGALKLAKGRIGMDDGSQLGAVIVDTITTLSLVGLTASCWAKIEASRVGTVPTFAIASIAGSTDPATLPASFTAAYDGDKQGFYIVGTKRVVGLAWINAAGALEGIVNCLPGNSYAGYSTSDDTDDVPYYFNVPKQNIPVTNLTSRTFTESGVFTADTRYQRQIHAVTNAANSFAGNIPAAASWSGKRIKVLKVDTGAGICTVTPAGAETFQGATAFPLRKQWDFIELESDGTLIYVVDSLATIDSAALAVNTVQSLAHGTGIIPRGLRKSLVCTSTELNYSATDEIDNWNDYIGTNRSASVTVDATNISVITVSDGGGAALTVLNKTTKAYSLITMNKWIIRTRYSI